MFFVDGKPVMVVPADDRSYQYGDGCFSTILTLSGRIQHWTYHRERLEACLSALVIPYPDWDTVGQWVRQAISPEVKAGIKIHISRGSGGRGYSPKGIEKPRVTISAFSYPHAYDDIVKYGIELGICQQKLGLNPLLAGHKHNNRLEQILLKNEMDREGCLDGVVLDIDDHVIETTMANIFWIRDDILYTPSLKKAGVAGVMRRIVLALADDKHMSVCIGDFSLKQLLLADEIFITNSILGIAPVVRISDSTFNIGARTQYFQKRLCVC